MVRCGLSVVECGAWCAVCRVLLFVVLCALSVGRRLLFAVCYLMVVY